VCVIPMSATPFDSCLLDDDSDGMYCAVCEYRILPIDSHDYYYLSSEN